jgi:hypothetical protein
VWNKRNGEDKVNSYTLFRSGIWSRPDIVPKMQYFRYIGCRGNGIDRTEIRVIIFILNRSTMKYITYGRKLTY